jgi:hypothetical protein
MAGMTFKKWTYWLLDSYLAPAMVWIMTLALIILIVFALRQCYKEWRDR